MIYRSDIIAVARSYIGVPFLHQGRTRDGVDCLGLIGVVSNYVGHKVTLPNAYSTAPSGQRIVEQAEKYVVKPQRQGWDNLIPGDIIVMWAFQAGVPQHFAIMGELRGHLTMIHALQRAGKVVEHNTLKFWEDRYMTTFCYPGTEKMEG